MLIGKLSYQIMAMPAGFYLPRSGMVMQNCGSKKRKLMDFGSLQLHYLSCFELFFANYDNFLTSERSEEVLFLRRVRRGKSTGGHLRSETVASLSVPKYRSRPTKIGVKVYWIKAPVLALSVLEYRAPSVRN